MKTKTEKLAVSLTAKDWSDLVNFLIGDLHCMEEGDPVKEQMRRICHEINRKLATRPA